MEVAAFLISWIVVGIVSIIVILISDIFKKEKCPSPKEILLAFILSLFGYIIAALVVLTLLIRMSEYIDNNDWWNKPVCKKKES